jgi:hypothetical protein
MESHSQTLSLNDERRHHRSQSQVVPSFPTLPRKVQLICQESTGFSLSLTFLAFTRFYIQCPCVRRVSDPITFLPLVASTNLVVRIVCWPCFKDIGHFGNPFTGTAGFLPDPIRGRRTPGSGMTPSVWIAIGALWIVFLTVGRIVEPVHSRTEERTRSG